MKTRTIAAAGILSALALILALLTHFPIFPAAPVFEYDAADIPIFLGTFIFSPFVGLIITVVVSFIQGFTVSSGGGIIGVVMHIISTGSFVFVSGMLFKKFKSNKGLIASAAVGAIVAVAMMIGFNLILTPIFYGMPRSAVLQMFLPVILPFNLIKIGTNTVLSVALYLIIKPKLGNLLHKSEDLK